MIYSSRSFFVIMRISAMAYRQLKQVPGRFLGVFVCLCFALQPLAYPLHLALVDHAPDGCHEAADGCHKPVKNSALHSHAPSGEHHDHDHLAGRSSPVDDHPDHPVEDHIQFLLDIATSPAPVLIVALALLPTPLKLFEPAASSKTVAPCDTPPPRPIPRLVASPRAPPISA